MLMTIILSLATPQACVAVKQQCRACTTTGGKMACSTPGIACQPFQRILSNEPRREAGEHPAEQSVSEALGPIGIQPPTCGFVPKAAQWNSGTSPG